jgi:hypothetical protein
MKGTNLLPTYLKIPPMPNQNKKPAPIEDPLISTGDLPQQFGLSIPHFKRALRQKRLLEGIHAIRVPGSRSLLWNRSLITDWLVNGGLDSPAHQRAIENWLSKLPSSPAQKKAAS